MVVNNFTAINERLNRIKREVTKHTTKEPNYLHGITFDCLSIVDINVYDIEFCIYGVFTGIDINNDDELVSKHALYTDYRHTLTSGEIRTAISYIVNALKEIPHYVSDIAPLGWGRGYIPIFYIGVWYE